MGEEDAGAILISPKPRPMSRPHGQGRSRRRSHTAPVFVSRAGEADVGYTVDR
jgi:hypothetical protein